MNRPYGLSPVLANAIEQQARIERLLAPTRGIADLVKTIQPPTYISAIAELAKTMQLPEHITAASQLMVAMKREHRWFPELARSQQFIEDVTKQIAQMQALSESITAPCPTIQDIVRSQSAVFDGLSAQIASINTANFSIPQFSQATMAWNMASIGLSDRMNDIGLFAQRELLSARLFEAPIAYAEFVRHTTERLAANPAPDIAARLRGSLNLAEQQLLDITDVVSGFIEVPEDDVEPDRKRELNAPFTQQDELLSYNAVEDETDTEAMTSVSPTAQTVKRGRRILELVTQCNEAGKTSEYGVEIFKPTTRLMIVFNDLPWLSPTDRSRFADVVDCLYFIFYEGAGKDHLRFLEKFGGPLTDSDCDLIWCIKHLRNKWSRHDADHGKEKDIEKSWAELAAKFRWLGLVEYPSEVRHFQQLHHQLLVLAESFLENILSKLRLKR